jgi:SAM-dependent methyltransferase
MAIHQALMRGYDGLARAIAPGLRHSQLLYEDELRRRVSRTCRWLDLGCGRSILPAWRGDAEQAFVDAGQRLVGVDVDYDALMDNRSLSLKCLGSASALPFAEGSFDLVTANMVVEHLDDPAMQFREIARVLTPGGVFVLHTPNALGYPTLLARSLPYGIKRRLAQYVDGRSTSEVYPTFYRANRRQALLALASESSFEILVLRFTVTSALFAPVLPLALLELVLLRLLMHHRFEQLRTNILAVLQKVESRSPGQPRTASGYGSDRVQRHSPVRA